MAIITLTTDLGLKDYYVSSVKGAILTEYPAAMIVDITHEVPAFDIQQAAFILKNAYPSFPEKTIHVIGVNAEADPDHPHVAVEINKHFFIGADNGIFSLLFDKVPEKIVELNIRQETDILTFPTRDVFVKAACHLARGGTMEIIGTPRKTIYERTLFRPVSESSMIRGTVIYIDSYKNVICNITKSLFKEIGKGRPFSIFFRRPDYNIDEISKAYNDVPEGEKLALFSSTGYLEIAINKGEASNLLGLKQNDTIRIEFYDR